MTRWLVLTIAIPLMSCAAKTSEWGKPGASMVDFQHDLYVCAKKTLTPEYLSVGIDYKIRDLCMVSKGWVRPQPAQQKPCSTLGTGEAVGTGLVPFGAL